MTGLTCLQYVEPQHDPNEGRVIINSNFDCVNDAISNLTIASATGSTSVSAGTNITTSLVIISGVPNYTVSVEPSAVTYTNASTTPTTIGGIPAGSTFSAKTMQEMWDALLYPYQYPAFTSFGFTQTSPLELGDSIAGGPKSFTWSISNSSNVSANTITITDITTPAVLAANINTSPTAITISTITNTTITSHSWGITAFNTQNSSLSSNFSISWYPRRFRGTIPDSSVASLLAVTNIAGLLAVPGISILENNLTYSKFIGTNTYNLSSYASPGGRIFWFYDDSLPAISSFTQGPSPFPTTLQPLMSFANSFGVIRTYKLYINDTASVGTTVSVTTS